MPRMIFSGSTREEAIQRAQSELGLPPEALEVEALNDSRDAEGAGPEDEVCIRVRISQEFVAQKALKLLRELLEAMKAEAAVELRTSDKGIRLTILAPQSSILIGREGHTLDAIQHWLIRAVAKVALTSPRILVDVENYRTRKFSKLERTVRRVARRVAQTGQAVRLDPMGPVDRKFIHNCLKDIEGITTYSLGREGRRHIVIAPRDAKAPATERDRYRHDEDDFEDEGRLSADEGHYADEEEGFSDEELIATDTAYSQLRVIANPAGQTGKDDELLDEELERPDRPDDKFNQADGNRG